MPLQADKDSRNEFYNLEHTPPVKRQGLESLGPYDCHPRFKRLAQKRLSCVAQALLRAPEHLHSTAFPALEDL